MKKSIVGIFALVLLLPAFSSAATTPPTSVVGSQNTVEIDAYRQELMQELIALLRTYIAVLEQQLALQNPAINTPQVLGLSTSTKSSAPAETPKKRKRGGSYHPGPDRAETEAKGAACKLADDLKTAPNETKLAYISESTGQPVYADWAPDTTKELYAYLTAYANHYLETGAEFSTRVPDYQLYYALQHLRTLETRFGQLIENETLCGEDSSVLTPLSEEILALTAEDPATSTSTGAYDAASLVLTLPEGDSLSAADLTVSTNQTSDYHDILLFNAKTEGGHLGINTAAVRIDVPGESITDVIEEVRLNIDGQMYDAEPYGELVSGRSEISEDGSYAWYLFDFDDQILLLNNDAIDNENIYVSVAFAAQADNYPNSQTVSAQIDAETGSLWDIEGYDNPGSGSEYPVTGEAFTLIAPGLDIDGIGIDFDFDENIFEFSFNITAIGGDFFVLNQIRDASSTPTVGVTYSIEGPNGLVTTIVEAEMNPAVEGDFPGIFSFYDGTTNTIYGSITFEPPISGEYTMTLHDIFYTENSEGTPSTGSITDPRLSLSASVEVVAPVE